MTDEQQGTNPPRILVVDDDRAIQRFLQTVLTGRGFTVHLAENAHPALTAAATIRPDLILLDLGLPDRDGIEVLQRLREWSEVPTIVLSVREREGDKVSALDAGADDYLTKPFGIEELLARIRVALRRSSQQTPEPVYRIEALELDLNRRLVTVRGSEVQLTPTEYELLRLLVTHAGKVMTHRQLLKRIWGVSHLEQPHVLRVNISNLRHKIEENPSWPHYIVTEPGVGYRFRAEG